MHTDIHSQCVTVRRKVDRVHTATDWIESWAGLSAWPKLLSSEMELNSYNTFLLVEFISKRELPSVTLQFDWVIEQQGSHQGPINPLKAELNPRRARERGRSIRWQMKDPEVTHRYVCSPQ
jgi:hypothetical protein